MAEHETPEARVAALVHLLDVQPAGEDRFTGRRKVGGVGRVFGGQVIAQALAAAELTVAPDREPHSLHAYFLRGGSEDHEVDYRIERDFDGGSFSNRRVIASQQGTPILNLVASFHQLEQGVSHQDAMPDVPGPDGLVSESDIMLAQVDRIPDHFRPFFLRPRPLEFRPVDATTWMGAGIAPPIAAAWFRAVAPLPDDPRVHRAVLAWASDYTLLVTCLMPHGTNWMSGSMQCASLDHALWLHDSFRADEWLLYATDSPWAGRARGFNRGRIFSADGRLVAEVAQEGMVRRAKRKD